MSERHKFICNKCNKDFATITLLNRHLQKKKIPCKIYTTNRTLRSNHKYIFNIYNNIY